MELKGSTQYLELLPGDYGEIRVRNLATLKLSSGVYNINRLIITVRLWQLCESEIEKCAVA
jgi:hypothetical protein